MATVTTTSTLPFSVDGLTCTVDGLAGETEYDCRTFFDPDAPGKRPSFTTNTVVDHAGVATWELGSTSVGTGLETRPGFYHTRLVEPGTATPTLDGPDGEPLLWVIRHDPS